MDIFRLASSELPLDRVLQGRVLSGRLNRTVEFLAMMDGEEAGLLVFDHWPDSEVGIVHEIYVLPRFKSMGIGAALLAHAQVYAIADGCSTLQLTARRLDPERFSDNQLISWYSRHGFRMMDPKVLTMVKPLLGKGRVSSDAMQIAGCR